jgi:hypothetical protein
MSFIIYWIGEMFSPLGLIIGGFMGLIMGIVGLIANYVFTPTDTAIYTAEYIQNFYTTQPIVGLICGVILIISVIFIFVGKWRGGIESPFD